jgi:putative methanogenesis marker protein 7
MEELVALVYDGGIYRFSEFNELLEDTGSFILRREDTVVSTVAVIAVPRTDLALVKKKARELGGTLTSAPLAMSEIAVVAPSPSGRHLPHPTCDMAEFMRRAGAQTIMISLARGVGQEPIIQHEEALLINESDAAVFALGDSKFCLVEKKSSMLKGLEVPIVVAGGPAHVNMPCAEAYVGGFGRKWDRMKGERELERLEGLVTAVASCLSARRKRLYSNLPPVALPALARAIERQVPDIMDVLAPSPITIKLDGLRVKLPYDEYAAKIGEVTFEGRAIKQIAAISRSVLKDYVLIRMRPVNDTFQRQP